MIYGFNEYSLKIALLTNMCERNLSTEHQETKLASKCRKRQNTRWKKPLLQKFRISSKWEEKVLKAFEISTFFKKSKKWFARIRIRRRTNSRNISIVLAKVKCRNTSRKARKALKPNQTNSVFST